MKDPIPLDDSDIDSGVEIVNTFEPGELGNKGKAQFFYHSKNHDLPIRDVTDTQKAGEKPEPCIERKAENYCNKCLPKRISKFANNARRRYLFLFTRCRNSSLDQHGEQYYVGYIDKRRKLSVNGRTAVQGPMKLVSFEDACPLTHVGPPDTRNSKKLDTDQTEAVLEYLKDAENIYYDCVEAVEELERTVSRARYWEDEGVPPPDAPEDIDRSGGC